MSIHTYKQIGESTNKDVGMHAYTCAFVYVHSYNQRHTNVHARAQDTRGSPGVLLSPAAFLLASSTPQPAFATLHTGIDSSPNDTVCVCVHVRACVQFGMIFHHFCTFMPIHACNRVCENDFYSTGELPGDKTKVYKIDEKTYRKEEQKIFNKRKEIKNN